MFEEFALTTMKSNFPGAASEFFFKGVFESTVLNTTDNRYQTDGSTYYGPNKRLNSST
jgi:hypothetical protein